MSSERLGVFRRFHVRLTLLYASAVLVVLGSLGGFAYARLASDEIDDLRDRLVALATAFASGVDTTRIDDSGYGADLNRRLAAVASPTADITSAWCFKAHGGSRFSFVGDYTRGKASEPFGKEYDATGVPLLQQAIFGAVAEEAPVHDAFGVTLSGYAPVLDASGTAVAVVGFDVDASAVDSIRRDVLWVSLLASLAAALLLAGVAGVAGRMLRGPLWRVIDATTQIADGRLAARVGLVREDEFGVLGRHFDAMAQGLEEREFLRTTFGRFVSNDVALRLLKDRSATLSTGEERVVTVLFSDLAGYSTVAERLEPPQVVAMLNDYVGAMTEVIAAHEGCVIEFLGDAILAVFGAPNNVPNHARRAVDCALAMRRALLELNVRWRASGASARWLGEHELAARIGIHTGPVVAGTMGSELRLKYAVVGDTVNVAARLEQLNKELGTSILVTAAVAAAAGLEGGQPLGAHPVKGRLRSVDVISH